MQTSSSRSLIQLILLLVVVLFSFREGIATEDGPQHPILAALEKYYFQTPREQDERPIKVTILGTTCNATEDVSADIAKTYKQPPFRLEYSKSVFIEARNNPDACLELDVPDIDTKFDLTFSESSKPDEISFTGKIQPGCKDCKPKRAKSISGVLRKIKKNRYRVSFTGDLADTFELVPTQ